MRHVCHGIGPRVFICVLKLYCVVLRAKTRVSKRVPDLPNRSLIRGTLVRGSIPLTVGKVRSPTVVAIRLAAALW